MPLQHCTLGFVTFYINTYFVLRIEWNHYIFYKASRKYFSGQFFLPDKIFLEKDASIISLSAMLGWR